MKEFKLLTIKNGDFDVPYRVYKCELCDEDVEEAWPHYQNDDGVYCYDCAFKLGLVSEEDYIRHGQPIHLDGMRAAVHDGKIYVVSHNRKFPWEKSKQRQRHDPNYIRWRKAVFERDGFKCQICGQVGGTLNAHHIKPFAEYEDLRFDVDNGITLCEKCHKEIHKKNG